MTSGAKPPELHELLRVSDRLSYLYLEHCTLSRDSSALIATDVRGTVHVPIATISCLLLGPGTSLTHQAMTLLGESGTTAVWVGEEGVRYYAHGRPITRSSRMIEAQARLVSSKKTRLEVARRMYTMRFEGEEVSDLTIQQLRGREGRRVRDLYRENAERVGLRWDGRRYDPRNFSGSDPVNMALSSATSALYGLCQSVIVALGCAPGLGFVHSGSDRAFVYDIADLYKADLAIPVAFTAAAEDPEDPGSVTRRRMRDAFHECRLLERASRDIAQLLRLDSSVDQLDEGFVGLWGPDGEIAGGRNYAT